VVVVEEHRPGVLVFGIGLGRTAVETGGLGAVIARQREVEDADVGQMSLIEGVDVSPP
jgi:hypothetical protein